MSEVTRFSGTKAIGLREPRLRLSGSDPTARLFERPGAPNTKLAAERASAGSRRTRALVLFLPSWRGLRRAGSHPSSRAGPLSQGRCHRVASRHRPAAAR
jgi:hypothetical protein